MFFNFDAIAKFENIPKKTFVTEYASSGILDCALLLLSDGNECILIEKDESNLFTFALLMCRLNGDGTRQSERAVNVTLDVKGGGGLRERVWWNILHCVRHASYCSA